MPLDSMPLTSEHVKNEMFRDSVLSPHSGGVKVKAKIACSETILGVPGDFPSEWAESAKGSYDRPIDDSAGGGSCPLVNNKTGVPRKPP